MMAKEVELTGFGRTISRLLEERDMTVEDLAVELEDVEAPGLRPQDAGVSAIAAGFATQAGADHSAHALREMMTGEREVDAWLPWKLTAALGLSLVEQNALSEAVAYGQTS